VSLLALGAHRAAMCENNVFHDGKAESGPATLATAGFVGAVKAFENSRQIGRWYPDPGVFDRISTAPFSGKARTLTARRVRCT
jgi:hypothetical protein